MKTHRVAGAALMALATLTARSQDTKDTVWFHPPVDLDQVVVTATRTQKKLKDTPVITQVITAKQIEERGLNNIQDLLQQEVPGLNFQEVGYGTDIDIQGLGAKHILFLIDGERIAGENSGNIDYQRINMYNVERIEIVKGASSALYGSQAMGGVVNIITKQAKQKVEVNAGVHYGQKYQDNKQNYSKAYKKAAENLDKQNLTANMSLGLKLGIVTSNTDFVYKSADGYQLYDKKGYWKYFPDYGVTVWEEKSTSPTSLDGYRDISVGEKLTIRPNKDLRIRLHGTYYTLDKYDFSMDNIFEQNEDVSYGGSVEWDMSASQNIAAAVHIDNYSRYDKYEKISGRKLDYENNIIQPRLSYNNTAVKGMTLTAGLEMFREELYSDKFEENSTYETKNQWYATAYVQDDYKITDGLSVIVGVRGDYHKEYHMNVTPKVSLLKKIKTLRLRANYAMGYRSPTLKELYMNWDHLGMFQIIGNKDLKPEHNNYVSLSGEYSHNRFNASCNLYGNWFRDKIEGIWVENPNSTSSNTTEYHYCNISKNHLMGVEAMAKVRVCRYADIHGQYNYLYVSKSDGYKISSTSPHSGTIRLECNSHVEGWETVLNICGNIKGKKDYSVSDSFTDEATGESIAAYYDAHVDAYALWDISITQYIKSHARLTLGATNLFDYHADQISFNSSTSPGRNLYAALNIFF